MDVSEIVDRDSLERWLKETNQPLEVCVGLAHRAAMRVLPIAWTWAQTSQTDDLTPLPFLRCNMLSSGTYWQKVPEERMRAAVAAANAAADAATYAAVAATYAANAAADAAADAVVAVADAAVAATYAANAATYAANAATYAAAAADAAFSSLRKDCQNILGGLDWLNQPLWDEIPDDMAAMWTDLAQSLKAEAARTNEATATYDPKALDWTFFVDWYNRALDPQKKPQFSEDLLTEIIVTGDVDWEAEPAVVLRQVNAIWRKHSAGKIPNAETVSQNPETGKLRITPADIEAHELLDEALAKLDSVLGLRAFDDQGHNQYNTIEEELQLLRDARTEHRSAPRLLHSTCVRVLGRLGSKFKNQVCPEPSSDANIGDLVTTVTEVVSDLVTYEKSVREAVKAKAKIRYEINPATDDVIADADDKVAEISEGVLADEMPELANVLRNPNASEDEKAEAFYVSASRLLKIAVLKSYSGAKLTTEQIEWWSERGVKITTNAAKIAGAGAAMSSPVWLETAIKAILAAIS